jgi:cell division protease FtsH
VAGEANVPFYSMAGSEFMEMLVGVGASRVRDLFGTAKKAGKAIIFIDEIDAIGRMRGGIGGDHGEREQTLNQILVEMDGFETNTAVVVLAATNRGDLLDPALLRPGRFDRRVVLEMPDLKDREEISKIHAKGKPFVKNIDWTTVARRTVGFSGADLENMLNEAAIKAARENKTEIEMVDIEEAALKVKLGSEKRRDQTDEDKLMTAYHEAGHAIVNFAEDLDPVHRISIVSRGMALGFTLIPPKMDRIHETKSRLIKQMAMAMGGRAAEDLVFHDITTGASSDISHVTNIARNMVIEWGMTELGPINWGPQIDADDFGKAWVEPAKISDEMQGKVDEEIKKLVDTALVRAETLLKKNRKKLDELAKLLVEKESLDDKEFEEFMKK